MSSKQDWVNFALQRPNYFPGQYLLDEDFELAHRYLSDRQRYVNSRLHLAGIVEGLEVEAIAGQPEVIIKSGTAIDGEGNLIILTEAVTKKINSLGWLCLRYHQEPKLLQQPEIPDSYTRFEETPIITLEAIQSNDAITITLAKVILENEQVIVVSSVRQYSGVRLPSTTQDIELRSDGQDLSIQGNLTITGALQLGKTLIEEISQSIPAIDRPNVIPSEKAVKDHIAAALSNAGKPTGEAPAVRLDQKDGKMVGWKIKGSEEAKDPTSLLRLLASDDGVEKPRLTVERDTGKLIVHETLRAKHLEIINPMRHRMYPAGSTDPQNPTIYNDIFEAEKAGVIVKSDDLPKSSYDRTTWSAKESYAWREGICYGKGKEDKGGAIVTLPSGYDTVWIRIANANEWHVVNAQFSADGKVFRDLGNWSAGKRNGNCYCPDGSLGDSSRPYHQWLPIPVGKSGQVKLVHKADINGVWFLLSGVAFSQNPWGHASQSALAYHWTDQVNQGDASGWEKDEWNGDVLAYFDNLASYEIRIPVVPSGRDKLLYLINHNDWWNGVLHTGLSIKIGGSYQPIERFLATYDNPFSRHWNSKFYNRYIAARIPADMIDKALNLTTPSDRMTQLISIKVDLTKQGEGKGFEDRLYFRELGTHDLELPYFL